jgi:acyl carrier protein
VNHKEVVAAILTVLEEVQALSGRTWRDLEAAAKPIGALDGFDSLCGVEATLILEERLNCSFGGSSAFVSPDGTRALSVNQIADSVIAQQEQTR